MYQQLQISLGMVVGISKVCTERDNRNNPGYQLPPVLPLDLCALLSRDFVPCLQEQRIRLRQKFSEEEVEKIDEQFRKLRLALKEESGFSKMLHIAGVHSEASLNTCKCFVGPLQALCQVQAALSPISP